MTKGPGSRAADRAMAYKLINPAQARCRAVNVGLDKSSLKMGSLSNFGPALIVSGVALPMWVARSSGLCRRGSDQ